MSTQPALTSGKVGLALMTFSAVANLVLLFWGYHSRERFEKRFRAVSMPRLITTHQLPHPSRGVDIRCSRFGTAIRMTAQNNLQVPIYALSGDHTPAWYFNVDGSISLIQGLPPWIARSERTFQLGESIRLDPRQTWSVDVTLQAEAFGDPFVRMVTDHGLPPRTSVFCIFAWVEWPFDQNHPTTESVLLSEQHYAISVPVDVTFH